MEIFLSILAGCYISISLLFGAYELLNILLLFDIKISKIIKIINRINFGIFFVLGTIAMVWFFSLIFYSLVFAGVYK